MNKLSALSLTTPSGIYEMPDKIYYHPDTIGLRKTHIDQLLRTPQHYKYYIDYPDHSDSKEKLFGRAFHSYILEPQNFEKFYHVIGKIDKRTKAGKDEWQLICEENPDKEFITDDDKYKIDQMAESLQRSKIIKSLLHGGLYEKTAIFYIDQILCRAKLDILRIEDDIICDLKTITNIEDFQHSMMNYNYHIQGYFYSKAYYEIYNKKPTFIFILIEKTPPYVTRCLTLDSRTIQLGKQLTEKAVKRLKFCLMVDKYPGYSDIVEIAGLPKSYLDIRLKV